MPIFGALKTTQGFSRHAIACVGCDEKFDAVSFVASNKGAFVGAVVVELFWGALHVKYVYVEEEYRGQGIGKYLMELAISYAKNCNCPFAFVETMSFQALEFYQNMGFTLEFTRTGYKHGTSFHYLRMNLQTEPTTKKLQEKEIQAGVMKTRSNLVI
jgi:ribosomal protein S18 acetylase RimI-like enzyme